MKHPMTQMELDAFITKGGQIQRIPMGVSGAPETKGSPWRRVITRTPSADADSAAKAKESK